MRSSDRASVELMSSSLEHAANCGLLSVTVDRYDHGVLLYQREVYHEIEKPHHDNRCFRSASENPRLVT